MNALLAAMLAFAVKFWETDSPEEFRQNISMEHLSSVNLVELAIKYADDALLQCGDETPSLSLLQALISTS